MEGWLFLLFPLILVLAIAGIWFSYVKQKQRREEMGRLADELGWEFSSASDYGHIDRYAHFAVFQDGHSQYAFNTLEGAIDVGGNRWPVRMGDYHYKVTRSNGKHSSTHTYLLSYLILAMPFRQHPKLLLRREGMFDAIKNLFGFDDIDFESAEFSRRYCVQSADRRFAYDVIHPRMIEFLLANEPPTIDVEYGQCLLCDGTRTWTPAEFRSKLGWARQFFELWPQHVTGQLQAQR